MKNQTTSHLKVRKHRIQKKRSPSGLLRATASMDNKQRVCLSRVLTLEERDHFNTFRIYREGGKIILEPVCLVPEKNHWIYKDPVALASLMKGIKDAEEGRLYDLGSFAKYAKDELED